MTRFRTATAGGDCSCASRPTRAERRLIMGGPGTALGVVRREVGVRRAAREDDRVLERLAGTLAEVGGHRVCGIAGQGDPALDIAGQRRELVEVVVQEVALVGLPQQQRDRVVPVGEPGAQGRQVGAVGPFVDVGGREAVDPTVRQGGVPEPFTVAPGLAAGTDIHGARSHVAPGRVAGVPGRGRGRPHCATDGAVQPVCSHHEVRAQLALRALHPAVRRDVGDHHPGPQALRWQLGTQDVQQGRAVHQGDVPEALADHGDIGAREPPPTLVPNAGGAVEDGPLAHDLAHAEGVQRVQGVRPEREPGTHLREGRRPLQHLHVPTLLAQPDRGCEAGDATTDHDCLHVHRSPSRSSRKTLGLDASVVKVSGTERHAYRSLAPRPCRAG